MVDATFLTPPSPGLSATLFQNRSVEPYSPKGLENVKIKVLFKRFILHYGFPGRIHSDQGRNFESSLIKELCKLAGVENSRTTQYYSMGNGMVEMFNQTLFNMLGTLEDSQKPGLKSYVAHGAFM